jgi:DNA-binding transcriptional LysR family regulator
MVLIARKDLIGNRIREPEDVLKFPMLFSTTRPGSLAQWIEAAGLPADSKPVRTVGFELQSMRVRAAETGLGIALVPEFFVRNTAWDTGVVRAHPVSYPGTDSYYLAYPDSMRHSEPLEAFREWILDEAQRFATALEAAKAP